MILLQQIQDRGRIRFPGKSVQSGDHFGEIRKQTGLCQNCQAGCTAVRIDKATMSGICESPEVAAQAVKNLEEALEPTDLEEAVARATEDVVAQREEALARQLAEMRKRRRRLVDPLQFEMSIQAEDLVNYRPAFGAELGPATEKQKAALEKMGILPDAIDNFGKASLMLDRLHKRRAEGLSTPKQIRFLEGKDFLHVGTWSLEAASRMITRIQKNNWRVPYGIRPATYQPGQADGTPPWERTPEDRDQIALGL